MKKPNPNERRLLIIFGALIFLILNILAIRWVSSWKQSLTGQVDQLEQTVTGLQSFLEERAYWETRQVWMQAHPLEIHPGQEADSQFAEEIQKTLTQSGLNIDAQQIRDSIQEKGLITSELEFRVKGQLEQVIRWLCQVQQPGKHVVIEALTLRRPDGEDAIIAQVQIRKIFRTAGLATPP